jgi:hypothetical protein
MMDVKGDRPATGFNYEAYAQIGVINAMVALRDLIDQEHAVGSVEWKRAVNFALFHLSNTSAELARHRR